MLASTRCRNVSLTPIPNICAFDVTHRLVRIGAGHRHSSKLKSLDTFHGPQTHPCFVGPWIFFPRLQFKGREACSSQGRSDCCLVGRYADLMSRETMAFQ